MSTETSFSGWRPRQLSSEGPRYLALVTALELDIADGRLVDGDRLPAHRDLAKELNLSVGTVSKAYQEAEQRGIVSGHVGHGTFVRRRAATQTPAPETPEQINLALNVPAEGSEKQVLATAFEEVVQSREFATLLAYHPHGGIRKHREIIAAAFTDRKLNIEPSRLFLCNGAQHALDTAVRMVAKAGDSIVVDEVTYSGFKAIAAACHVNLVPVAMDEEGTDPDALRRVLRESGAKVIYSMPTLHSPTTRTMSLARRRQVAELAEEFDAVIIEDDVYGFFFEKRCTPIAALAPDRTFYVTSFSKCVAAGFRLGTLTVPASYIAQAELILHASAWFVAPMLGETAVRLMENGKFNELLGERRREARDRYQVFTSIFPQAARLESPAFYAWLPLPLEWSPDQFAVAARGRGILVTPPIAFAVGITAPKAARICLGAPKDHLDLSAALTVLRDILARSPTNAISVA